LVAFTSRHGQFYLFGRTLVSDQPDNNASYLFDKNTFFTAKTLNMAIPCGPKFKPLYRDMDTFNEDWNKFNDIGSNNRYTRNTRLHSRISITPSHAPSTFHPAIHQKVYICTDDPNLPVFYFDPAINPISLRRFTLKNAPLISHKNSIFNPNNADDDEFELPEDLLPFLEDDPRSLMI
jgi:pre-mRNA-processing factor 8